MKKYRSQFIENIIINFIFWSIIAGLFYFLRKDKFLSLVIFVLSISVLHALLETLVIFFKDKKQIILKNITLILVGLINLFFCGVAVFYIITTIRERSYLKIGLSILLGVIFYQKVNNLFKKKNK